MELHKNLPLDPTTSTIPTTSASPLTSVVQSPQQLSAAPYAITLNQLAMNSMNMNAMNSMNMNAMNSMNMNAIQDKNKSTNQAQVYILQNAKIIL
jgi:hypothetical protein